MNKFKVNNIFVENGKTLDEIVSNFFITFLDKELNFFDLNDVDTILNS
jgi:hypothetical protein